MSQTTKVRQQTAPRISAEQTLGATDWSVGRRLRVGFAVVMAIGLVIAAIGLIATQLIANTYEQVSQGALGELEALNELENRGLELLVKTHEYALIGNEETLAEIDESREALNAALENYVAVQQAGNQDTISAEMVDRLRQTLLNLKTVSAGIVTLYQTDVDEETLAASFGALKQAENDFSRVLDDAQRPLSARVDASVGRATRAVDTARLLLVIVPLVGLALTIATISQLDQFIVKRLSDLTDTARQIAAGNLDQSAVVDSNDEIGILAETFNTMTARLRELLNRFEKRSQQLETIVGVSQRLSGILDLSDLMRQVVNLTKETFNYYHVHIYLLDDEHKTLIMAEGYGEAGAEMKRQGHHISLTAPKSLVARAAREGRVITVENVREDPDWLPNPLLPDTHSEMAVPVRIGVRVVGVLDVQSESIGGLAKEDEVTLQNLANQVATAIRNARLFSETQEALYRAEKLRSMYTGEAWEKFSAEQPTTNYEFRQQTLPPLEQIDTPEAQTALQNGRTVDLRMGPTPNGGSKNAPRSEHSQAGDALDTAEFSEAENALATPLKVGGEIIGVLGIRDRNPDRRWTSEEIALIEAVSEQMSLAIENARLFDETGRRAGREKIIANVTQQVWASDDLQRVMQTAVEQLGATLGASKVVIQLGTQEQVQAGSSSGENGQTSADS